MAFTAMQTGGLEGAIRNYVFYIERITSDTHPLKVAGEQMYIKKRESGL